MLKLNRQLNQIGEMKEHYTEELANVSNQIQTMEEGLIQFYKYKSMESELGNKLEGMRSSIEQKYNIELESKLKDIKNKQNQLKGTIQGYEKYKEEKKEEFKTTLKSMRNEREATLTKLETYNVTQDFNPIYTTEEIEKMSLQEMNEYIGEVVESCKEIQGISMQYIPTTEIDPEMWFVVDKLNLNNGTAQELARAINVVAVLVVTWKFSPIIFGGLTAFTSYTIFKNKQALRPIKQYKDFIYTAYNNEKVMEDKIDYIVDQGVGKKIEELEAKLERLKEETDKITNKINIRKDQELEEAEDLFHRDLDKYTKDIEEERNSKLEELKRVSKTMETTLKNVFDNILYELRDIEKEIEDKINESNKLELDILNNNTLIDLNRFHLGKEIENEELNRFENLPFGSYMFIYDENREGLQKLLMYITVQMAGRIRGDLMKFNIIDPVDFGKGVNTIGSKEMHMFYSNEQVEEVIDLQINKFTEDVQNVLMGYNHIVEYNKTKDSTGSALYPYTLNIIQNLDIFNDTARYRQLLRTTQSGVINLIMISKNMMLKAQKSVQDSDVEIDEFMELVNLFPIMFNDKGEGRVEMDINQFYSVEDVSDIKKEFDKVVEYMNKTIEDSIVDVNILAHGHELDEVIITPYIPGDLEDKEEEDTVVFTLEDIKEDTFRKYGELVEKNIKEASVTIYYFDDMMDRVGKQLGDSFFSREPTEGVNFPIGYENGDVDKIFEIPFNDYHIHAFMGGRTGMGKSNMSNVGLNSALYLYSPDALEVYYLDGKQAEGAKYMRNVTPHFKCLATTSDPDYLISLFENIFNQMVWRQKVLLADYNAGKLGDIREKYYDYVDKKKEYAEKGQDYDQHIYDKFNGNESKIKEFKGRKVAEILIVVDELAEILKGEPEAINKILKYIDSFSALGRATGVHLWLMSQGVPDKMDSSTMAQVVTRLALPVSTGAVSKALVGNESAADPDYQGKGNLLFNDKGGDMDANVRIKVPIIQPEDMDKNLGEISRRGVEAGFPIECVVFDFDETESYKDNLEPFLMKNKEHLVQPGSQKIVVGGNVLFTDTPAPVGFDLGTEEGDNLVVISQSSKKRIELTNTAISNFAKVRGDNTFLLVYRGNKDFQHFDYTEEYKDDFRGIFELEEVDEFVDEIQNQPLRKLEMIIRNNGLSIVDKLQNITEQEADVQNDLYMLESLVELKPDLVEFIRDIGTDVSVTNRVIDNMINYMRDVVPINILLVEGIERVQGIGVGLDYMNADIIKDAMLTSPYYNMHIVFTASVEPQSFNKLESCFRHALLGNLDVMSLTKYKFMRDAPEAYGGYGNTISSSANFKFKIFNLENVKDDVQDDPRVIVSDTK